MIFKPINCPACSSAMTPYGQPRADTAGAHQMYECSRCRFVDVKTVSVKEENVSTGEQMQAPGDAATVHRKSAERSERRRLNISDEVVPPSIKANHGVFLLIVGLLCAAILTGSITWFVLKTYVIPPNLADPLVLQRLRK